MRKSTAKLIHSLICFFFFFFFIVFVGFDNLNQLAFLIAFMPVVFRLTDLTVDKE